MGNPAQPKPISLKAADPVLPKSSPERRLIAAVLRRAILDAKGNRFYAREPSGAFKLKKETKQARDWLYSESDEPWTFIWVCEQLELNSQKVLCAAQLFIENPNAPLVWRSTYA